MPSKKRKLTNKSGNSRARKRCKIEKEETDEEMIDYEAWEAREKIQKSLRKKAKLREVLKDRYYSASAYDTNNVIDIGSDYKSNEKYSKATYYNILTNISCFSDLFPSNIIAVISELSEGRIVCCAECGDVEFAINRDLEIDRAFVEREAKNDEYVHDKFFGPIFSESKINEIVEADADRFVNIDWDVMTDEFIYFEESFWGSSRSSGVQPGYQYVVICRACHFKFYCSDHCCFKKCAENVDGNAVMDDGCKRCVDCKGLFCARHQDWENWGYVDNKKYCTQCGWFITKEIQNEFYSQF